MRLVGTYDLPTPTKTATVRALRVVRLNTGARFKTVTLLAAHVTLLALGQIIADRNAMPATLNVMVNNGFLVST